MSDPANSRLTVSQAAHHRRRRRVAGAAVAVAAAALLAVVAVSAGSGGSWNPAALRDGVKTELPRLRLEEQARRASAALARQQRARTLENAAIARTLKATPFVRMAGSQTRSVALTFDDGPGPFTQRILDTLKRYDAQATFFTLGFQLGQFPLPLQRAVAEGHAIGDHTWNHKDLTKLGPRAATEELSDQAAEMQRVGLPRARLFRPPYGAFDKQALRIARREGMLTVLWSVDPGDYAAKQPKALRDAVLANVRPGSIVLMHDGGGDRDVTARALPLILRALKQRGYRMVTVPQLLMANPAPAHQDRVKRTPVA